MFAEICTTARIDSPQATVEQFLSLHRMLFQAVSVAEALATCRAGIPASDEAKEGQIADRQQASANWINTALASDLATFSLQAKQDRQVAARVSSSLRQTPAQSSLMVMLEAPLAAGLKLAATAPPAALFARTTLASRPALSSSTPDSTPKKKLEKALSYLSSPAKTPVKRSSSSKIMPIRSKPPPEEPPLVLQADANTKKLHEIVELGKQVHMEAQKWFLQFMEGALDSGFRVTGSVQNSVVSRADNSQIASMLSQLKHVNDWLDQVQDEGMDPNWRRLRCD